MLNVGAQTICVLALALNILSGLLTDLLLGVLVAPTLLEVKPFLEEKLHLECLDVECDTAFEKLSDLCILGVATIGGVWDLMCWSM